MNKKSLPFIIIAFLLLAVGAWFLGRMTASDTAQTEAEVSPPAAATTASDAQTSQAEAGDAAADAGTESAASTPDEGEDTAAAEAAAAAAAANAPDGGATREIGWMHGNCLVVQDDDLKAGSELTIIAFENPQTVRSGVVKGPVSKDGEECTLLDATRRARNSDQGSVYEVDTISTLELGAAIIHPEGADKAPNPMMLDADEDTILDTFTVCSLDEGVQFSVWNAEPFNSKELWRGNYKLDEKTSAEGCP